MDTPLIQNLLAARLPAIDHASGVWLVDVDGRRYLDGCSGAVVANIGHTHPHVVGAMKRQAARATFTHRGAFTSGATEQLATKLAQLTGYAGAWFVNSGSEAVEAALQFALQFFAEKNMLQRQSFLSFEYGYHGNTLGGLSLSGHVRRRVGGAMVHDFARLPAPYSFREGHGLSEDAYAELLLDGARKLFVESAATLAGLVVEPVGGATLGATVPPDGYLQGLRALCDEFEVLMIADEVMTGLGRTGRMLASEHWGVRPDIVVLGKGLGAGYTPIAATLLNQRVLDEIERGSGRVLGGHTYAGNPFSSTVALAVLEVLEDEKLVEAGRASAPVLRGRLVELARAFPGLVADVRGVGMLLAVELQPHVAQTVNQPQGWLAGRLARFAQERGLIVYATTGGFNEAFLVAPPLTISAAEIEQVTDRLRLALGDLDAEINTMMGAA